MARGAREADEDVQIEEVGECKFGQLIHADWAFI
jgi:hypothetical protein